RGPHAARARARRLAGRAPQGAQAARRSRREPHAARVPPDERRAVEVPLLRRARRARHGPSGADGDRGVACGIALGEGARELPEDALVGSAESPMRTLAPPNVERLTPYVPGKPIEELERELGISGAVKLASNENPMGPSPKALEAVAAALRDVHRYP